MLSQDNEMPRPTCGVVIEKSGDQEKICPEVAADQVTIADPSDQTRISAVLLVCKRHSNDLDMGKSLIFLSDDGKDRIGVQFDIKGDKK